ncbi:hypothetical protein L228DRAFT_247404 [Xylona heveae TC161]|uniref:Eukaryotic mitochondrial regulator protein-domain-containing protein n=1 Tax=Xylona heveae (strain CBS 132557 / TC161) TaxID=1328760 RepID=A0A165H4J3_XYLHT|nr:hypothetical protein L228DRAFT_247404 [Xylona heveae TC161]KZF22974.1 hypothetical protein L228DRAFT_247404 [Xylona heveae TC161]
MPPRIRKASLSCPLSHLPLSTRPQPSSLIPKYLSQHGACSRDFSTSLQRSTGLRRDMFRWLNGPGAVFRDPAEGSTNYLSAYDREGNLNRRKRSARSDDAEAENSSVQEVPEEELIDLKPFPMNRNFISHNVLSEELREEIYSRVVTLGRSVRVVSAELGIDMNRVGAVVRLKTIEKEWQKEGKTLAKPYARAVMEMVPKTPYNPNNPIPHESINDLPVHSATMQQIFEPTSESRRFTREDAAKVFHPKLLPADKRIPHPELIELERERLESVPREERINRQRERLAKEAQLATWRKEKKEEYERKHTKVIAPKAGRWEFRFTDVSVDAAGKDGRGPDGVGWRYGMPHEDRKRGQVKIPTSVPA